MATDVCIIGHSYIRRLRDFTTTDVSFDNLKLDWNLFKVEFRAKGGLTFPRLAHCAEFLNFQNTPAVWFIQLGGNDLCHAKPEKVTTDILSYAQYLKGGVGIRNVVIGQLLRRQPWASRASYNVDVVNVNRQLKSEVEKRQGIHFWTHRGFWTELTYLGRDGVHIDAASRHMKKYLHSIRIAVIHHSR